MNRDRLHLWQDRLARNDSQYENWYALMDERERLYQGSRYIFPLVNKYRPSNAKTPHVRNICSELIEAQVDSNIPSPKVTAVHEKDEPLAKIIEDMLRNEMDRLPFAEINDLMERIVPIQGGGAYLVEWDNTCAGRSAPKTSRPPQTAQALRKYTRPSGNMRPSPAL